jgi:hypothetical protein
MEISFDSSRIAKRQRRLPNARPPQQKPQLKRSAPRRKSPRRRVKDPKTRAR